MSKRRYERILDKVREEIATEKVRGPYPYIRPSVLSEKLGVKESVVNQACSVLQKEGLLSPWRGSTGTYIIKMPRAVIDWNDYPMPAPTPKKRRVSWGSKRRVLALVRKDKPWVVEKWYKDDQRWYMYMEGGCASLDAHKNPEQCSKYNEVAPEDQPDLSRTAIARWHFEIDQALAVCADLRRKFPQHEFRIRDTSKGDYLMGAIL